MSTYLVRVPGKTYQELRIDAPTRREAEERVLVWLCGDNDDEAEDGVEIVTDLGEAPFHFYAVPSWITKKEPTA